MAMATCSPWGFPKMPRISGSFMPDTVQGRARSVSSSYKKAHQGHISTGESQGWTQMGFRWSSPAQVVAGWVGGGAVLNTKFLTSVQAL